jgi:hypothetical protein
VVSASCFLCYATQVIEICKRYISSDMSGANLLHLQSELFARKSVDVLPPASEEASSALMTLWGVVNWAGLEYPHVLRRLDGSCPDLRDLPATVADFAPVDLQGCFRILSRRCWACFRARSEQSRPLRLLA